MFCSLMGMSMGETKELIRCSICNKVVPKQQYCPKCGKLLIKNFKNTPSKITAINEYNSLKTQNDENADGPKDQLEKLRQKIKKSEDFKLENLANESNDEELGINIESKMRIIESEEPIVKNTESKDIVLEDDDLEEIKFTSIEDGKINYKPDKYTLETVQKIAKNIKYEAYLVNLLKGEEIAQDAFFRLYNGLSDDTHKMIVRRGELIEEIDDKIIEYTSIVASAQQGMKLLNIRKSINDASEGEYKVKAAALKWDIDNYGSRINEEEQKTEYLKNLGSLIDVEELDKLTNDVNNCTNTIAKLDIEEKSKEKIKDSMREALTVLKETTRTK